MSKYYSEEGTCAECGKECKISYMIGVSQPLSNKCSECKGEQKEERIENVLSEHPNAWYRPDSDEYEIAVYKPNGDTRYYRHEIHAIQRIESWYEDRETTKKKLDDYE